MFELKDKAMAEEIIAKLKTANVNLRFMHVCGTHQETLMRHGLDALLKDCGITVSQGPGCPVCVTTAREIEEAITLARKGFTVASFGDMLQVPGRTLSLQQLKTDGFDVRMVYSIEDAVSLAKNHPSKKVVFLAVGFETTAPSTAAIIAGNPPENFSILSCHRMIPPALKTLMTMGELRIDGFIEPGHVSTIIGMKPYEPISRDFKVPQVIAGFEPLDVLMAVWMLVQQVQHGEARVENEYVRAVKPDGNAKAKELLRKVFKPGDVAWRGFPVIPESGLFLRSQYERFDARVLFADALAELKGASFPEPTGCLCGAVLRGVCTSSECPLFGCGCTPQTPLGPCMVSREGSCRIEYLHKKR
jgi:hydrogenase expression/formation protein HypD